MTELIDPFNAHEVFTDGIHEVKILESVARIVWFSRQDGVRVLAARLAVPVSELPDVIQALVIALAEAAKTTKPASG